jgi:hypothetical protein
MLNFGMRSARLGPQASGECGFWQGMLFGRLRAQHGRQTGNYFIAIMRIL